MFSITPPEYNHANLGGALKNANRFSLHDGITKRLFCRIWAVPGGGVRAVENLRLVMGEIKIADFEPRWRSRCGRTSRILRPLSRMRSTTKLLH